MNINRPILTALLAIIAVAGGSTVFSQEVSLRPIQPDQLLPDQLLPELTESDIEIIRNIVRVGLSDKEPGTEVPWENEETGNSGVVILRGISVREDMECREVTHTLRMAGENDRRDYDLTTCLNSDGTWMMLF